MRRPFRLRNLTPDQLRRREELPIIMDGYNIGGCVPMDDLSEEIREELDSETVEFQALGFGEDQKAVDMPVLKFNEAFKAFREERINLIQEVESNGQCLLPWEVLKTIPADRKRSNALYFSQGNLGSCMSTADAFALHSSILIEIGIGKPFVYSPYNNVVTFGIVKGNLRGGLDVASMAEGSNRLGHYPIELVGDDNQRMPSNYKQFTDDAKQFQAAIMFLDFKGEQLADEIIQCCRAGLSVPFGNSTAVSGSTVDSSGIKVAKISSSWAHACGGENTCVYTTQGIKTYGQLAGKHFHVLSWSHRLGRNTVKRASCIYGGKKPCVEVQTNIGTFVMSYDHPFLTKDGFCVPAANLKEWQSSKEIGNLSLFQCSTRMDRQGYAIVPLYDGNNQKTRLHRLIGRDILGAGKDDVVHHIDENPINNAFENLAIESRSEHSSHHWVPCGVESHTKKAVTLKERHVKKLTTIDLPQIMWLSIDDVAFSLNVCHATIANKLRCMNAVPEKIENSRYYWSRETWVEMLREMEFRQNGGSRKWHRPQDHYIGKRYIEFPENRTVGIHVLSVKDCGIRDIYSIQVYDPEPDDKRPLTEHNYMICPEGSDKNLYTSHGVFVGNTSFTAYRVVNGTEYVFWVNSHGPRYNPSDEGEPGDGCWMTRAMVERMCSTMPLYGSPYVVIPESVWTKDRSLVNTIKVPFPVNWRR